MNASPFDFLFPRYCLGCHRPGVYFCSQCVSKIKVLEKQLCPVCEKPAISGQTHASCHHGFGLDGLVSVFAYDGIIKKAIQALKYKFISDLAESLMDLASKNLDFFVEEGIIIPIPLSSSRQNWRGFNQAEILGKIFARKSSLGFNHQLVERVINTVPQVGLDAKERKENLQGAFRVMDARLVRNKILVIFDDVWTTGATLRTCASTLKREGAAQVWGLTLAR